MESPGQRRQQLDEVALGAIRLANGLEFFHELRVLHQLCPQLSDCAHGDGQDLAHIGSFLHVSQRAILARLPRSAV
ncbi:hypothetical protein [Trinickia mobilis]|uniref:hypothetical protein n=1 Tax=Trinickia mobilis TaxID=2816356 RepID=UPI001A906BDD|nr:hypothetical protein [Trinickia mobilis]